MLVPAKHISFSESLLGLGSYLLKILNKPKSIDEIWNEFQDDIENNNYPVNHSLDNLMLSIIFLYSINSICEINGKIQKI